MKSLCTGLRAFIFALLVLCGAGISACQPTRQNTSPEKITDKSTEIINTPGAQSGSNLTISTDATSTPQKNPPFTILWAGDTLLGDAAQPLLDEQGYLFPFDFVNTHLVADYSILNLEGPITDLTTPFDPGQRWSYNADPKSAEALATLGFDAVSLANNHSLDRDKAGLEDTFSILKENGITAFGAGVNFNSAVLPVFINTPYGTVAVVGFSQNYGSKRTAGNEKPGNLNLDNEYISKIYQVSKSAGAKWIVAYVHWGDNYSNVTDDQQKWAQQLAFSGYDLVIGHHPHMVQPIDFIGTTPIVFSLGNFVFGSKGRFTEEFPGFGLLIKSELTEDGFTKLIITCIQTDNDIVNYQPRICTPEQSQIVLKALHPRIDIVDSKGILDISTSSH